MRRLLIAFACLLPAPLPAQSVSACDARAQASNITEPWEHESRSFANGKVRLAVLDTIEPGAAAFNILVLSPPGDELGGRQCRIVSLGQGIGFAFATLKGMAAAYDPATGLAFTIQVSLFNAATGGTTPSRLYLGVNQSSGAITARLQ